MVAFEAVISLQSTSLAMMKKETVLGVQEVLDSC